MRTQHLALGLDLQGGIHLVMGVEVESVNGILGDLESFRPEPPVESTADSE